jgi:hypothetical protein
MIIIVAAALAACGGGGGGYSPTDGGPGTGIGTGSGGSNSLSGVVDLGPAVLQAKGQGSANTLFVTVTVCAPGTGNCQDIDHVQVDTGSTGLRILSEALTASLPQATTSAGANLFECEQFVDSFVWGSVATADVTIGQRKISSTPVHIIGTTVPAPSNCASGTAESSLAAFGANGLLGIGTFLQDCGAACAETIIPATYYACNGNTCASASIPTASQLQNPIAALGSDNNGVTIQFPSVGEPGASSVSASLLFGVGTESNNGFGSAQWVPLDGEGTFTAQFGGNSLAKSFIDSGSNAYFFPGSLPNCPSPDDSFYCPTSSQQLSASILGRTVNFQIDNADQLFKVSDAAYPGLGGGTGSNNNFDTGFDFGLPFFYGRTIYVLFEGRSAGSQTGPAVGF